MGMRNLRQLVNQSRMSLQDVFRDFDRTCRGQSQGTPERVLSLRNIRPETDDVLCIIKKYGFKSGGGNGTVLVRYRPFLSEVGAVGSVRIGDDKAKGKSDAPSSGQLLLGDTWRAKEPRSTKYVDYPTVCPRPKVKNKRVLRDSDPLADRQGQYIQVSPRIKEMGADLSPRSSKR